MWFLNRIHFEHVFLFLLQMIHSFPCVILTWFIWYWFLLAIHWISHVILTRDSFKYTWFLHMIHFDDFTCDSFYFISDSCTVFIYIHMILTYESVFFQCDFYTSFFRHFLHDWFIFKCDYFYDSFTRATREFKCDLFPAGI